LFGLVFSPDSKHSVFSGKSPDTCYWCFTC